MKLHFLYGTETGSAEFLCEDIIEALDDDTLETEVSVLADVDPAALIAGTFYVVVTSTFGNGDCHPMHNRLLMHWMQASLI
jgi:MioC protein